MIYKQGSFFCIDFEVNTKDDNQGEDAKCILHCVIKAGFFWDEAGEEREGDP